MLGVNTMYMLFCFFKLFLIGCIGLRPYNVPCDTTAQLEVIIVKLTAKRLLVCQKGNQVASIISGNAGSSD